MWALVYACVCEGVAVRYTRTCPQEEKQKGPIKGGDFCGLRWGHWHYWDTNSLRHRQGIHMLCRRTPGFLVREIEQSVLMFYINSMHHLFSVFSGCEEGCWDFDSWALKVIQDTWKGWYKVNYVLRWTLMCFDPRATTDRLYRYQTKTEWFQFPKWSPASFFFFSFSWYSRWTVIVRWCWTIGMLQFPLTYVRTVEFRGNFNGSGYLFCNCRVNESFVEWGGCYCGN